MTKLEANTNIEYCEILYQVLIMCYVQGCVCAGAGRSTSATGPTSPTQTTTAASPTSSAASGTAGANIFTGQQIFLSWINHQFMQS